MATIDLGALDALLQNIRRVIVGKDETIDLAVATLLARGHVLIEDRPGLGKTMLSRAIAQSIGADFHRIQCTPDLLPSDVTGVSIYRPGREEFEFIPGPVFTQVLLVDEINRTTPRTQSALLEAMEESQVTVEGDPRPLPDPFFVIATQNPIELAGTFPLPEAQIDRFLVQLELGYPQVDEEVRILAGQMDEHPIEEIEAVITAEQIFALQNAAKRVHVAPEILRYIAELAAATRRRPDLQLGVSPRGSLALMRMSQAFALLNGIDHVTPDLVKKVAPPVLAHRLVLSTQRRAGGASSEILREVLADTPVPTLPGAVTPP